MSTIHIDIKQNESDRVSDIERNQSLTSTMENEMQNMNLAIDMNECSRQDLFPEKELVKFLAERLCTYENRDLRNEDYDIVMNRLLQFLQYAVVSDDRIEKAFNRMIKKSFNSCTYDEYLNLY